MSAAARGTSAFRGALGDLPMYLCACVYARAMWWEGLVTVSPVWPISGPKRGEGEARERRCNMVQVPAHEKDAWEDGACGLYGLQEEDF
jgi:hypothetical protein